MDIFQTVVGSEVCSIVDVESTLRECPILAEKWSQLARGLGIPPNTIKKLRQDMLLDKITYSDLLIELLQWWVAHSGSEATIGSLLHLIEEDCGALGAGETIRSRFNLPQKPKVDNRSLRRNVEGSELIQPEIINQQTDTMCTPSNTTLPEIPSYYIQRTLITRNIISCDIFEHDLPEIFLFHNMERAELIARAKKRMSSTSREQLWGADLTAKFVVMNQSNHFEKICEKTTLPVHLLRKEDDGRLRWLRSKGEMKNLQIFVHQSQDEVDEATFCREIDSYKSPVCISDSPGMGKSLLLASIGSQIARLHPGRLISFSILREFMKLVKEALVKEDHENVVLTLTKAIGTIMECLYGKQILQTKPNSQDGLEPISCELLLDGFDELDVQDHKFAFDVLGIIQTSFKSVRLWVTTRPHLLQKFENNFHQLGYCIREFIVDDQIQFLTAYWSRRMHLDKLKCKQFAQRCLQSLKSKLNSHDRDIAGIPLQCLLIGESYEDDAVEYSRLESDGMHPVEEIHIEIGTITSLYRNLISKKIQKFLSEFGEAHLGERDLMEMHVRFSLELLFPEHLGRLDLEHIIIGETEMEQTLRIGILEKSSTAETPRFLHRTFAEYFVAWFVFDCIDMEEEGQVYSELVDFFFHILESQESSQMGRNSFTFIHPVICYFLDSIIPQPSPVVSSSKFKHPQMECFRRIAHACANDNHINIFNFFIGLNAFHDHASAIFDDKFIYLIIWNSSLEMLKPALRLFEEGTNFEFDHFVQIESLRTAIKRGKLSVAEFLLKEKELSGIVQYSSYDFIHDCVQNSKDNEEFMVEQKIQMLRILVEINPTLLKIKGGLWKEEPLLSYGVHIRLLEELIALGADVLAEGTGGHKILHLNHNRNHLSGKDYHKLVLSIPDESLRKLVNVRGVDRDTPLMTILRRMDPEPETVDIYKNMGADFKCFDANGQGILKIAIKNTRNPATISAIIACGGKVSQLSLLQWRLSQFVLRPGREHTSMKSLLHNAAEIGNLEVVTWLLEDMGTNINAEDEDGLTPLNYAIIGCSKLKGEHFDIGRVLRERGGTFKEPHANGRSLLHIGAENGNLEVVRLLVHLGVNLNAVNVNGNTALHCAAWFADKDIALHIIQYPMDNGADIYINGVFLHKYMVSLPLPTPSQFHEMVAYLLSKKLFNLFNMSMDANGATALHLAVAILEPQEQTMALLKANNIDFNAVDFMGESILTYAFRGRRSRDCINNLINEFGVSQFSVGEFISIENLNAIDTGDTGNISAAAFSIDFEIPKGKFTLSSNIDHSMVYHARLSYCVNRNQHDVPVVLRLPNPSEPNDLNNMLSELKIIAHIGSHPQILEFIGASTAEVYKGIVLTAMPFYENVDLEYHLISMRHTHQEVTMGTNVTHMRQPFITALSRFAHEIAFGMEYVASKKIIHLNLTARNVLLDSEFHCKIADFRMAKYLGECEKYEMTNGQLVPVRWLAIESLERLEFSFKSDVWSYGVTLWEIFSLGEFPYRDVSLVDKLRFLDDIRNGFRISQPPLAPPTMYEEMRRCWRNDPDLRPTFGELVRTVCTIRESVQ